MRHESLSTTGHYYIYVNIDKAREEINEKLRGKLDRETTQI